ncbi:MAG: D-2-hydroxyacid dehydrogenase [Dehalococcoidia bacterium]|jgi:phosphoglycerate dehydrogenase-like enzyme|nr:hydroxyacid dehydrogenase [Chloroflexota bacterium]MDP6056952.1 D-2-hydroxyacid dehydrogenase [Dehalococcoidia bacterium]MDP7261601.1 D-2-hydroxyacid dehydrogenase [Dehalococcoidia bacterium]MDP7485785.1 D-2-hydroxyacid dehydrogenase [Dehalococcoidia bacterium]|tara:strand:+ start:2487 stop:3449 length:963 start_codon:yes stop_codon:yes gene_type:complete
MKALLLADFGTPYYPALRNEHPGIDLVETFTNEAILDEIGSAELAFGYLTGEQFAGAGSLKWIQTTDAGMEGLFDAVPDIVDTDVVVTNARGAGAPMIGEHGVALMLALARQLPRFAFDKAEHRWDQDGALEVVEYLGNKTCGIIGFGKSGREIGWRAKALGMNILAVDEQPVDGDPTVEDVWGLSMLNDLLEQSDYVVVTAPYTPRNENMIGADELALMKTSARIVVTSRGRLVEHDALVAALKSGRIAGAGLDTAVEEPLPADNELWDLANVIITPHIAGNSEQEHLDKRTVDIFAENLRRYVEGQPLINIVDKQLQY